MKFVQGNLLDADVEAVVNTVNTVGVMGKGIALMFKERFGQNYLKYSAASKAGEVVVGRMFVTENLALEGPRWIINFPTKKHWRNPTQIEWVDEGLKDLRQVILDKAIHSIAIPPLGCGNGGLDWHDVRPLIESRLASLTGVEIVVYEPTEKYQNIAKRTGVEKLTPARALVAEMVRRYWILGIECTLLEVQKIGWFLERTIESMSVENPLKLNFAADRYGPYSDRLRHLLDGLDGSYLHCDKRLGDAGPTDTIWFDEGRRSYVSAYLQQQDARILNEILTKTTEAIDGFESPLGMELLSTVDWLLTNENAEPTVEGIRSGLSSWPAGVQAGERKNKMFDDRMIELALVKITHSSVPA